VAVTGGSWRCGQIISISQYVNNRQQRSHSRTEKWEIYLDAQDWTGLFLDDDDRYQWFRKISILLTVC